MTLMFKRENKRLVAIPVDAKIPEDSSFMLKAIVDTAIEPIEVEVPVDEKEAPLLLDKEARDEWLSHFVINDARRI